MDFHDLISRYKPLIKQHWIPLGLACIGLIFLAYGLIALLASSNSSDSIIFEPASPDASRGGPAGEVKSQNLSKEIMVDVAGAVVKPGVYHLSSEARLQDALIAAGGLSGNADRAWVAKSLNLAAKLQDAAKIYIPNKNENSSIRQAEDKNQNYTGGSSGTGVINSNQQMNVNTANQSQLESLSGVGSVTAQKIIDGRPYSSIEELLSKKIVGKSVFGKIKDKLSVY